MKNQLNKLAAHLRRTKTKSLMVGILALGALPSAPAQVIYSTGFEEPALLAGIPLAGQDGWMAPPPLSPNAAVIVASGKRCRNNQTVHVEGFDLEHQDFINEVTGGYYDAIGSYRHPVDYDTGGTQTVRISADVRLRGRRTPHENFFSASIAAIGYDADGNSSGIGELAISSDGHVYGYSGQNEVPVFLVGKRVAPRVWHRLAIEVDFAERTYSFYVDDSWLGTFEFDPSATSNILRRGSMLTYAAPDCARQKKADYMAIFDNFAIVVVPESPGKP